MFDRILEKSDLDFSLKHHEAIADATSRPLGGGHTPRTCMVGICYGPTQWGVEMKDG